MSVLLPRETHGAVYGERMEIRSATEADREPLRALYRAFAAEIPPPEYVDFDLERELLEVDDYVRQHIALVAEDGSGIAGFVLGRLRGKRHARISDLYVVPERRGSGIARALLREATVRLRGEGAEAIELDVQPWNEPPRGMYERWGFSESLVRLAAPAAELEQRLSRVAPWSSRGVVFVQTDDESKVERAVRAFLPRLGRSPRTDIHGPENGWIAVDDELCSGDPKLLRRLAQELSYRTGGVVLALGIEAEAVVRYLLFERGSIADEYASVPEYDGPLPPGDVVALSANPTVAQRLTGADPDSVRAVARSAASPAELPAPAELFAQLAALFGVTAP
jgi:ribosomal protein S18 acetylase RimI-like enzyme